MRKIIVTVAPVCHVGKEQSLREVYEKMKM